MSDTPINNGDAPQFVIPDEFKDAGALKGITSTADLFKKVIEQESHIGKISREKAVPGADDDDTVWNTHIEKMKTVVGAEDFGDIADADTAKLFKDAGISKRQAKGVIDFVKGREAKKYSKEEFDIKKAERFKDRPGDQKKIDAILSKLPQETIDGLLNHDNDYLLDNLDIFAKVADIVGIDGEAKAPPATGSPAPNANHAVDAQGNIINDKAFDDYLDEMAAIQNSPTAHAERTAIRKKYGYQD